MGTRLLTTLGVVALLFLASAARSATNRSTIWTPVRAASTATPPAGDVADASSGVAEVQSDSDPDLPPFMQGRIDKQTYLQMRSDYIAMLRGLPYDLADNPRLKAIDQMRNQIKALGPLTVGAAWTPIGPDPIPNGQTTTLSTPVSGRVSAIAIDPTNPNKVYVGAAQGGVYRSLDGGTTWTPIFDQASTLAIGSLALAPSNPSILYVGTGEANLSGDSFFGIGLYRIDNVDTAPLLNGPFNPTPTTDVIGAKTFTGRSISKILVSPADPATIFVSTSSGIGGLGADAFASTPPRSALRGIYRSTNATSASPGFQKLTVTSAGSIAPDVSGNRIVTDMIYDPTDATRNTIVCWVYGAAAVNDGGIYRTTNALAATPAFSQTFMTTVSSTRGALAVNRVGAVTTMLVATGESATGTGCTSGSGCLRRSTDGGVSWSAKLSGGGGFCGGQCFYDLPVAIHPANASIILIGGAGNGTCSRVLARSINAGASFTGAGGADVGLHADAHAIEFAPSDPNIVYQGNDGGIFKSTNAGATWTSLNNAGFSATQFQSLALHPVDPNFTIGGTQDNGTPWRKPDATWFRADYGDGGFSEIDQTATDATGVTMYHTYYNVPGTSGLLGFARVTSTACATDGEWVFRGFEPSYFPGAGCEGVPYEAPNGIGADPAVNFYAPMALGPGVLGNTVYYGSDRLYRSVNKGDAMAVVSQAPIDTGAISAIGISPQNDNVRIVGLNNGKVWSDLLGAGVFTNMTSPSFPVSAAGTRYVARAIIDPNNVNAAWVAFGGFGMPAGQHVWKNPNLAGGGLTWVAAGNGLPDVPVNALVIDPMNSNTLYAGTDIGVYVTIDGGSNWLPYTTGMPVVAVFDIGIQNPSRILRCATHGRGMWERALGGPTAVASLVGTQILGDRVELHWYAASAASLPVNVYRRPVPGDWARLGQVVADGLGQVLYVDRDVVPGRSLEYAIGVTINGREQLTGQVWVDIPQGALALEPVSPNPVTGRKLAVSFTLANAEPATLELVDVTGRRVSAAPVGSLGPGRHRVDLGRERLAPGIYWVRLSQAERMFTVRANLIR